MHIVGVGVTGWLRKTVSFTPSASRKYKACAVEECNENISWPVFKSSL